ncbi:S-4TM family putative pore-forming effector [Rathayibacter sp. VKM Ac-2926]|uniref:S-4TM family putative pore-forming effector n=1 Tax=Rathayibacter sp. VKM Ac-2926 TaxID=2929477 RepID=UPI001FB33644|nr:S-4TM family putative pore-forming effector [Rathayibacter sp. VKM Ac-2926]MCJ1703462.1 S-4TM family putative pore-forming effector [Rathayibacter sp. VKM Ac-2926]
MNESNDYTPPLTGATLLRRQDELDALRLLIAQKRLYSRAKRWVSIRWFGMLIIGLAAPIVAVIWPQSSVVLGSIAGAWLFLGRTLLMHVQKKSTEQAAAVQEQFDFYVYEMSAGTPRPKLPSLEDISLAAGPDSELAAVAAREKMLGWYVVADDDPGAVAVAIAQRSNAAYSYRLLRFTGIIWSVVAVIWAGALTTICVVTGLTLVTFLLGVVLPLLPAFLDVTEYIVGIVRSARDREALYREIESRIGNTDEPITGENLRVWQESLFELRRDAPTVPDLIYKLQRGKNEAAMSSAASQLSKRARAEGE